MAHKGRSRKRADKSPADDAAAMRPLLRRWAGQHRGPWLRSLRPPPSGLSSPLRYVLRGHKGAVRCLASFSDGRIVSGGDDHTVRIWDPPNGTHQVLEGHTDAVLAVAVTAQGQVVSAGKDGTIRVWPKDATQSLPPLLGHKGPVNAVAVTPDGLIVSGSDDCTVRFWAPHNRACVKVMDAHRAPIRAMAVINEGRILTVCHHGVVMVHEGETVLRFASEPHTGRSDCYAISQDGTICEHVIGECARIFKYSGGLSVPTKTIPDQRIAGEVWMDACAVDTKYACFGLFDGDVLVWDHTLDKLSHVLHGHSFWVRSISRMPDGGLVSGGSGGEIHIWALWDAIDVAEMHERVCPVSALYLCAKGRVGSIHSEYNKMPTVCMWDITKGCLQKVTSIQSELRIWHAGEGLLVGARYDARTGPVVQFWNDSGEAVSPAIRDCCVYDDCFVAQNPDTFVGWDGVRTLCSWHVRTGKRLEEMFFRFPEEIRFSIVVRLSLSRDHRTIAALVCDRTESPPGYFSRDAYSNFRLVFGDRTGKLHTIDFGGGVSNEVPQFKVLDAARIAVKLPKGIFWVLHAQSGRCVHKFSHVSEIGAWGQTEDHRIVGISSHDDTTRIWQIDGESLECLAGVAPPQTVAAYLDGKLSHLALSRPEGTVILDRKRKEVAWYPERLDFLCSHDGITWAGASGAHLHILRLENAG